MESVICSGCRSPIGIPAGCTDATIRCGICWTEVERVAQPVPLVPAMPKPTLAKTVPLVAKPIVRVAAALPSGARPAAGMAKLDALIQKASLKLTKSEIPVVPVVVVPADVLPIIQALPRSEEIPTIEPLAPKPSQAFKPRRG